MLWASPGQTSQDGFHHTALLYVMPVLQTLFINHKPFRIKLRGSKKTFTIILQAVLVTLYTTGHLSGYSWFLTYPATYG
jgi:hypothetical protein